MNRARVWNLIVNFYFTCRDMGIESGDITVEIVNDAMSVVYDGK